VRWRERDQRYEARAMVAGVRHPEYGKTEEEALNKWQAWYYGPQEPSRPSRGISRPGRQRPKTLDDLFDLWLEEVVHHGKLAKRTQETYEYIVGNRLREAVGQVRLSGIVPADIRPYFATLIDDDIPTTTVARIRTTLSSALRWAVDEEWIERSPMWGIKTAHPRPGVGARNPHAVPKPPHIPEHKDVARFMAAMKDDDMRVMWLVGFAAGLRASELVALSEDELIGLPHPDLLAVRRKGFVDRKTRKWVSETPKQGKARELRLPTAIMMDLYEQARLARQKVKENPEWATHPAHEAEHDLLLFRRANGLPHDPSALPEMLRSRCRRAGVPVFSPHAMRHYCASMLLEGGMPTKHVSDWLGHTTTVMVENTYGHVLARLKGRATEAQVISAALGLSPEATLDIESSAEAS
jgi:integrase